MLSDALHSSGDGVPEQMVQLLELAELSLECGRPVIAPDQAGNPVLPAWFLVEISRDLPRLVAARA